MLFFLQSYSLLIEQIFSKHQFGEIGRPHLITHRSIFGSSDSRERHSLDLVVIVERHLPIGSVTHFAPILFIVAAAWHRLSPSGAQYAIAMAGIVEYGDCLMRHSCEDSWRTDSWHNSWRTDSCGDEHIYTTKLDYSELAHTLLDVCIYIYIYIYLYMCECQYICT